MIGDHLRKCRKAQRYTQREIAEYLELTPVTYARYELGIRTPDIKVLFKLADFYGVTLDYLVGRTGD